MHAYNIKAQIQTKQKLNNFEIVEIKIKTKTFNFMH